MATEDRLGSRNRSGSGRRQLMRHRLVFAAVLAVALGGLSLAAASATPGVDVTSTVLGRGTIGKTTSVNLLADKDIVMAVNTFAPGGSSGWHAHPGGAIVVVQSGQITLYRTTGERCTSHVYTAGDAFFERPGAIQNGVNEGDTTSVLYVAFPSVPKGGSPRIDVPAPKCSA
jgi:quercetin dioxygenase-like cupin family protein